MQTYLGKNSLFHFQQWFKTHRDDQWRHDARATFVHGVGEDSQGHLFIKRKKKLIINEFEYFDLFLFTFKSSTNNVPR